MDRYTQGGIGWKGRDNGMLGIKSVLYVYWARVLGEGLGVRAWRRNAG